MSHDQAAPAAASSPLNVLLAVRNDLQRYGIAGMLRSLDLAGRSSAHPDLAAAVAAVRNPQTDILLAALDVIDPAGESALRRALHQGVRALLLLPGSGETALEQAAVVPGASLLASDDLGVETLRAALSAMDAGEVHVPAALARALVQRAGHGEAAVFAVPRLTPREKEALALLVDGLSNRQIARRMWISEHGAKRLVANILAKLNCPNRTLAAARALREGLCGDQDATSEPRLPYAAPVPASSAHTPRW